eukprot:m.39134 g.39134  ORF g.39134 m.39134 type:complete len:464 (-) comp13928_c0_seq2:5-1396(-)
MNEALRSLLASGETITLGDLRELIDSAAGTEPRFQKESSLEGEGDVSIISEGRRLGRPRSALSSRRSSGSYVESDGSVAALAASESGAVEQEEEEHQEEAGDDEREQVGAAAARAEGSPDSRRGRMDSSSSSSGFGSGHGSGVDVLQLEQGRLQQLERENMRLRDETQTLEHALANQHSTHQDHVEELVHSSLEQEKLIAELRAECQSLRQQVRDLGDLQESSATLEAELAQRQLSLEQRAAQHSERFLADMESVQTELTEAERTNAEQVQHIAELEAELKHVQTAAEIEIDSLRVELASQTSAFAALQAEALQLEQHVSELEHLRTRNQELQDQLDEYETRRTRRESISAASPKMSRASHDDVQTELERSDTEKRREMARLRFAAVVARLQVDSVKKQLHKLSRERTILHREKKDMELQIKALGLAIEQMKMHVDCKKLPLSSSRHASPRRSPTWSWPFTKN